MLADLTTDALTIGVGLAGAYVAVTWVAIAFWVVRDARRRSESKVFAVLAAILGFFPPFIGALTYFIIRPPVTLEEQRILELEEVVLRSEDEGDTSSRPCPSCGRAIEHDFVVCPYCRTQFSRRCASCSRNLRLGWSVCPYCAEEVGTSRLSATPKRATANS